MAEPADADRELENGRFVRNRVVMVQRGRQEFTSLKQRFAATRRRHDHSSDMIAKLPLLSIASAIEQRLHVTPRHTLALSRAFLLLLLLLQSVRWVRARRKPSVIRTMTVFLLYTHESYQPVHPHLWT